MTETGSFTGEWWQNLRDDLDARFVASKDSQGAIVQLAERYGQIPVDSRREVDDVLAEWLLSDDESLRYDGVYIVNQYLVRRAEPALRTLQGRLENRTDPSAPYDWAKVNRVIGRLVEAS